MANIREGNKGVLLVVDVQVGVMKYGRGLASVALGLLGSQATANRIWRFYQAAVRNPRETHFVGALWRLIDLEDERNDSITERRRGSLL